MEPLIIEKTAETPEVKFNSDGSLKIHGVSTPSNVHSFYTPIFDWIASLKDKKLPSVNLEIIIDYMNTSSSRVFVDMINLVKSLTEVDTNVNITWYYDEEDEDMLELGEDLSAVTDFEFSYRAI